VLRDNVYNSWVYMGVTDPFLFIRRLKINYETHPGICVYSWIQHCRKHGQCTLYVSTVTWKS
jgi:hypothetical protein